MKPDRPEVVPNPPAAAAAAVNALIARTAEHFAKLPLEAEPADFRAEQQRRAP
jgi:hypothetical protein